MRTLPRNPRALFLCLVLPIAPAMGQPTGQAPAPKQPAADRPASIPTALSEEPFRLESVGLLMRLPADATAQAIRLGNQTSVQITPADKAWAINIQTPKTGDPAATAAVAAERTIKQFLDQPATSAKHPPRPELLTRNSNLVIPGSPTPAERFYLGWTRPDGEREVRGYTVFKPYADQFVVFEFVAPEASWAKSRPIYELTVATVSFEDPSATESSRRAAVAAGRALIDQFTPELYLKSLPGQQQWFRLCKPAPTGAPADAEELGYRSVRFWRGRLKDIPGLAGGSDNPEGILVEVAARVLDRQGASKSIRTIDTIGTYFMTLDRREEAWSVRTAVRDPRSREPAIWTETGFRRDKDIQVAITQSGQPARNVSPVIQGDTFLTQVEVFLLPRLVIPLKVEADLGFYTYRTDSESFTLRRETVRRDAAAGGAWTIVTLFRDQTDPQTSIYRDTGDLVRTTTPDGKLWEPISPEELMRLWRSKNLPTGAVGTTR